MNINFINFLAFIQISTILSIFNSQIHVWYEENEKAKIKKKEKKQKREKKK